jgi:hypothetical protein
MKPHFAIVALVILALAVPASMLAQQNSKAEKEIRAALDQYVQTNLKGGTEAAATFDKLLADDYVRIAPNGAVYTKAEILDGWKTGKMKVESLEFSDIKIYMYGNTAVATGIERSKATVISANVTAPTRFARVFVKRGGVWKVVLYQNTPIKQ